MTTIACDGKFLVSDSRTVFGTMPARRPAQKLLVRDGAVYAVSGLDGIIGTLADWYVSGADPRNVPQAPTQGWEMYVVTRKGTVRLSHTAPYAARVDRVWSTGSGQDYALGAMHAGADARRAVKISSKLDVYTGGPIQVIDLAKVFKAKGKRRGRK